MVTQIKEKIKENGTDFLYVLFVAAVFPLLILIGIISTITDKPFIDEFV